MSSEDLDAPSEQKEVIDEKQGSILMSLIKQLRIGMDLTRVTLPTFILEPRSFLERMSDFMIHKDLLLADVVVLWVSIYAHSMSFFQSAAH
jgi:hypothetical protein